MKIKRRIKRFMDKYGFKALTIEDLDLAGDLRLIFIKEESVLDENFQPTADGQLRDIEHCIQEYIMDSQIRNEWGKIEDLL